MHHLVKAGVRRCRPDDQRNSERRLEQVHHGPHVRLSQILSVVRCENNCSVVILTKSHECVQQSPNLWFTRAWEHRTTEPGGKVGAPLDVGAKSTQHAHTDASRQAGVWVPVRVGRVGTDLLIGVGDGGIVCPTQILLKAFR
jgi:hypothetical protein